MRRVYKKSELIAEGYRKGLQEAQRIIENVLREDEPYRPLKSVNIDPSVKIINGHELFTDTHGELKSVNIDPSKIINGHELFTDIPDEDPSELVNGSKLFRYVKGDRISSVSTDFPKLTNGYAMYAHSDVSYIDGAMPALKNATGMFEGCEELTSFFIPLPSLDVADDMFADCRLDVESIAQMARTIKSHTSGEHCITIGVDKKFEGNRAVKQSIDKIRQKGWDVDVEFN